MFNKKNILFLLASISSIFLMAQPAFERLYGGTNYDYAYSVQQTYDGGYIVAGSTSSYGNGATDLYLVKVDSFGAIQWRRAYGGINIDFGKSVKQTIDTGYVVVGYTNSFGNGGYDIYVIKTDKYGDTLWTRTYGGADWDFGYSIDETYDNAYIIAGGTYSYGNGNEDMYLLKITTWGDTVWTKTYGGTLNDEAKSVEQTSDNGFIICGFTGSIGDTLGDTYTIKTDLNGDTIWTKTLGGPGKDWLNDIHQTMAGGYISCGVFEETTLGYNVGYVIMTDAAGDTMWTNKRGHPNDCEAFSICESTDGAIVWAGKLNIGGDYLVWLYKTDGGGNWMFANMYGNPSGDNEGCSVQQTMDSGFIVAGNTTGFNNGLSDMYVFKTDNDGISSGTVVNNATSISDLGKENIGLMLFPNPSSDICTLVLDASISDCVDILISDQLGRLISEQSTCNTMIVNNKLITKIDVSQLQDGMYFIKTIANGKVFVSKFIVKH